MAILDWLNQDNLPGILVDGKESSHGPGAAAVFEVAVGHRVVDAGRRPCETRH